GGCVPSTVRTALGTLTDLDRASFIDLGCGKGRAMAVALEFPFRAIIGLEMNASLVATALANAAIVRRSHPNSPEWRVLRADATAPEAPEGDIVYFLANPFGRGPMEQLLAHIQKQMAPGRRIFVVYENPVQGLVFDNDPGFSRWYAAHLPYDADEIGFGPDETESVVIWAAGTATPSPHKTSGVIAVKDEVMRAEVEG
ncbi:MAG: class I SAM-dependent methyltransferase, partial [Alphaproteobacteria bacterium]|nr:class I SAM-dependent methyltransferase [Alphaproteobacteria bacterium]